MTTAFLSEIGQLNLSNDRVEAERCIMRLAGPIIAANGWPASSKLYEMGHVGGIRAHIRGVGKLPISETAKVNLIEGRIGTLRDRNWQGLPSFSFAIAFEHQPSHHGGVDAFIEEVGQLGLKESHQDYLFCPTKGLYNLHGMDDIEGIKYMGANAAFDRAFLLEHPDTVNVFCHAIDASSMSYGKKEEIKMWARSTDKAE
jgi:hypothetical protein